MEDPVMLVETGHTYERQYIEVHLARSDRAPLSGVQLQSKELVPNHAMSHMIEAYLADRTLGMTLMEDPVMLVETGHTYERQHIEVHLARSDRAPLSGVQLQRKELVPNHAMRHMIEAYLA